MIDRMKLHYFVAMIVITSGCADTSSNEVMAISVQHGDASIRYFLADKDSPVMAGSGCTSIHLNRAEDWTIIECYKANQIARIEVPTSRINAIEYSWQKINKN